MPTRDTTATLDALLATATSREPLLQTDGKSGASFERVEIDGERYVLKHLALEDDWIMRATGDLGCRPIIVWESGLLDRLPACVDHAVVAAARTARGGDLLMRDVGPLLVPEGDAPLSLDQHLRFVDHMAALHAELWGWEDDLGLASLPTRFLEFCPAVSEAENRPGGDHGVPPIIGEGWRRFPVAAPQAAAVVLPLLDDIGSLVAALARTPTSFLHGDWKLGNLGSHPDGRTILLDFAVPGAGPPCSDFTWYLALNRARLPAGHTKDSAIDDYRAALERHGIDTEPWWADQLALCLLGAVIQFGWEKALGDAEELAWWEERAVDGARLLRVTLFEQEMRDAYGGGAGAWAAGPAATYEAMAAPLATECPVPLDGASVLDFGAGTGATSRCIAAAGARITAADLTLDMLRESRTSRPPCVNADVVQLPLRDRTFDVAVGAFVISHVAQPSAALREVARTVRADGAVLTVGFDARWDFPPKQVIEDVLIDFGLSRPSWYDAFKNDVEPQTAFPERLATVARYAGLTDVSVHERAVDVHVGDADGIIAWRIGNPVYAPFIAGLDDARRREVLGALRDALGPDPAPLVPELLVLVARVPDRP